MLRLGAATMAALLLSACYDADAGLVPETPGPGRVPPADHAFVIFASDTVTARVADTPQTRERGLMGVESLADGEGMLFVFDSMGFWSFWMRGTPIDLDIAFFGPDFRVIGIQQMTALSEEAHTPPEPIRHALEVPRGWFAANGIREGSRAQVVIGSH